MRYPTRAFQSDTTVVSNDRRHPHHVSQTKAAPANPSGRLSPTLLTKPPAYQFLILRGGFLNIMADNGGSAGGWKFMRRNCFRQSEGNARLVGQPPRRSKAIDIGTSLGNTWREVHEYGRTRT